MLDAATVGKIEKSFLCSTLDDLEAELRSLKNINEVDEFGQTPLILAILNQNISAVRLLISKGANASIVDNNGLTAKHYAQLSGNFEIQNLIQVKV
ncbi:hypothetical protein FGO68_gene9897 [Halteria grandinella]|uniref:Ankyrin repeat domain-containing protein n=1 Tax=Halteria grandinella TaxID=5974 RepID=A0A8J8N9B0_HALGN|nr:hypothetical protein FGO68_gene9897 [Halteria grandinella]